MPTYAYIYAYIHVCKYVLLLSCMQICFIVIMYIISNNYHHKSKLQNK